MYAVDHIELLRINRYIYPRNPAYICGKRPIFMALLSGDFFHMKFVRLGGVSQHKLAEDFFEKKGPGDK